MSNTREIVDNIISGDLNKAHELFNESVSESIKNIISEKKSVVAAEVLGTSIVEDCKDKEEKEDKEKEDKKKSEDTSDD